MNTENTTATQKKIVAFISSDGFIKYFKNTSWLLVARICNLILAFFVTIYVINYLGPHNYGILSYSVSFVGLFAFLGNLGIDQILYRELIKDKEKKNVLLGTSLILKIMSGVLVFLIIISISIFFRNFNYPTNTIIALLSVTYILQSYSVITIYFDSQVRSKYYSIISVSAVVILSLLKILLVQAQAPVIYFAILLVLEPILYGIGLIYFYNRESIIPFKEWKINIGISKFLFRNSWPLMLASLASVLYSRIDQVMLGQMRDVTTVGLYDAAVRIAEVWYFIPTIIISSLFPAIINAQQTDKEEYKKRLSRLYQFIFWVSIIACIGIFILAPLPIKLYGSNFAESLPVLRIYLWGGVGLSLFIAAQQWLIAENYTTISLIISLSGAALNILLNMLLIPKYGMTGAAVSTLISYASLILWLGVFKQTRQHFILMMKSPFRLE